MALYDSIMKKHLYTFVQILGFLRRIMIKETGIEPSDFLQHVLLQYVPEILQILCKKTYL